MRKLDKEKVTVGKERWRRSGEKEYLLESFAWPNVGEHCSTPEVESAGNLYLSSLCGPDVPLSVPAATVFSLLCEWGL